MDPAKVKDGDCIFVKSDMFDFFANTVAKQITSTYTVISHNGDLSTPDGQDDAPRIGTLHCYVASPFGLFFSFF